MKYECNCSNIIVSFKKITGSYKHALQKKITGLNRGRLAVCMFGAEIKEKLLEFSIDGLTRVTYFLEICQSVNLRVTLRN